MMLTRSKLDALGLIPSERKAKVVEAHVTFNYTTVLSIVFLLLSAAQVVRFLCTEGRRCFA